MSIRSLLVVTAAVAIYALAGAARAASLRSIVLVHGAFADGSGWRAVYDILKRDGYRVSIVQNPTESLDGDVAAARRVIDEEPGSVVLVGHSYGGAVITEAGNDPKVAALVYIAAFAPDAGESVGALSAKPAPDASKPPILPPRDGALTLERSKFPAAFAADVNPETAAFMADSQTPCGLNAFSATVAKPAWKDKPSWYVVAKNDRMIPPSLERSMAERARAHTTEIAGSHAFFISQPKAIAAVIEEAARSLPPS